MIQRGRIWPLCLPPVQIHAEQINAWMLHLYQRRGISNTANSPWAAPRAHSPECNGQKQAKNATPTWDRHPGSVGNLWSMGTDWFHQESLYGSGSKRKFLFWVRSWSPSPGQKRCLAVATRQQRQHTNHGVPEVFVKGRGWVQGGWRGLQYTLLTSSLCREGRGTHTPHHPHHPSRGPQELPEPAGVWTRGHLSTMN